MVGAIGAVLLFAGCSAADGGSNGAEYRVGSTTYSRSFEFYQDIEKGMEEGSDGRISYQFQDPNGELSEQTSQIENFIATGVDLVTMVPIDSDAAEAAGQMVTDAGIPLITVDIEISHDVGQVSHVASNNFGGGELAAEKMADFIGGSGEVVIINNPAITAVVDRAKGFEEKLAEIAPDIDVVANQSGDSEREKAQAVAEDLIQSHPDVKGIFAVNDEMALGALQAVVAAGLEDQVSIIGFDASSEGLNEVADESSPFKATIAQDPIELGRIVSETALAVLSGEEVDKVVEVPVVIVDSTNVGDYIE